MKEVIEFTAALQRAVKSLQFYSADHPRAVDAINDLERVTAPLFEARPRVTISEAQGALVLDGQPLVGAPAQTKALAAEFQKRNFGGLVLVQGVTRREITVLVRLLSMKPEQIKSAGGAEEILRREEVLHLKVSNVRYEAVTDGEEVVWSKSIRRGPGDESSESALPSLLQKFLLSRTKGTGGSTGGSEGGGDEGTVTVGTDELAVSLATALQISPNEGGDAPLMRARDLLQGSMSGLDPVTQIALLVSLDRLPPGTERDLLKAAASQVLGTAPEAATHTDPTKEDSIESILRMMTGPDTDNQLDLLRDRLTEMGISREQLDELLSVLTWEKLSVDDRIDALMQGDRIFEIPSGKLLRFLRDLAEEGQHEKVLKVIERYVTGLDHGAFFIRRSVCDTLGLFSTFIRRPGLSPQVEQLLGRSILNHAVREVDPRMKTTLAEASATLILMMVATGRAETALRVINQLHSAFAASPSDSPVRATAEALRQQFGTAEHASEIMREIGACDADRLTRAVLPLVGILGDVLVPHVIESLASETDRNRRGRFVRALKTIGSPAFPFLIDSLASNTWFIIRNALNVLADIGTTEHVTAIGSTLHHDDPRVRRAAVRALHRIAGPEAEALLITAINDKNAETQAEVLAALGAMKAQGAVAAVSELAKSKKLVGDDKIRETAIATLGQIGSEESIPVLSDILRPKGLFGRDGAQIRIAAARALAGMSTPNAKDALKAALASETDKTTKETLKQLVAG
jgi:HEAT repeat protein